MEQFEGKNDFENTLITSIRKGLTSIGPEESLKGKEGFSQIFKNHEKDVIYDFEEGLKYKFNDYFFASLFFTNSVLKKLPKFCNTINLEYGNVLYRRLCKEILLRITSREKNISEVLNQYLTKDDIEFAHDYIIKQLTASEDDYKIILFIDSIKLREIKELQIGDVQLVDVDEDYLASAPKLIEVEGISSFFTILLPKPVATKENLLKCTALEVIVRGCHLENEMSVLFEVALYKFRSVFAFLHACKFYLENLENEKCSIETYSLYNDFLPNNSGFQQYYIHRQGDISAIKKIETKYEKTTFSNLGFVINRESANKLSEKCNLSQFNQVWKNFNNTEVAKKILRSLDWLLNARTATSTNSIINYFIALETLLSTGESGLNNKLICENIAIMTCWSIEERLDMAKKFKKILDWRNRIFHHGSSFSDNKNAGKDLQLLKVGLIWTLMGILRSYNDILKCGEDANAINQYFLKLKLSPKVIPISK